MRPSILLCGCSLLGACALPQPGTQPERTPAKPTSVIVLIADGAGVGHWTLADHASPGLAVRRMPVAGLINTRGSDHEVSGSAPGATALATGVRSFMGAVSVGPDSLPRETVLEVAAQQGWSTGLVTTTWLTDATPAAFGAHVPSRSQMPSILLQFMDVPVNVLFGGGRRIFEMAEQRGLPGLRDTVMTRYTLVETEAALDAAVANSTNMLMGLFAPGDLPRAPERAPSLPKLTSAALEVLSRDPDGFFLMVENEGSDTEAHRNQPRDVLTAEMLDFDAAVAVALDFASTHPSTLVLVTADHETGGIHLTGDDRRDIVLGYATGDHTAALIPMFAAGPGSVRFGGLHDNDEVGRLLLEVTRQP